MWFKAKVPYIMLNMMLIVGLQLYHPLLYKQSYSESPSFVRQEIKDAKEDWQLWNGALHSFNVTTHDGKSVTIDMANKMSDCKINGQFISPDIESVSYKSDGKTLDGTIWLTAPFMEPPINDTIDTYQEELRIEEQNQNLSFENYTLVKTGEIGTLDLKIENLTLSGIDAHRVVYNDIAANQKIVRLDVWAVHNNKAYDFMFTALDSKYKRYYPIFESMINSLKIKDLRSDVSGINQPIQGMKTYEDSDIKINYPSDWQALKSHNKEGQSIILRSPFEDSQLKESSWHETTFTMAVDLDSVYDAGTDYRIIYTRIPHGEWTGNWTRQVEEISAYDRVGYVEEKPNSSLFDVRTPYRIPFSFNLEEANSPEQYKDVFYVTDHYVLGHHFCRLVDTTNLVIVPPPKFIISTSPSSLTLRPGEVSNILVEIKGSTSLQSEAALSIDNNRVDLSTTFIPNKTSIPSSSAGTATLQIMVLGNTTVGRPTPVILPIKANISFPTTITNRGGDTFSNNKSITLPESSNFTLTILPHYTSNEQLNSFVNSWITPVSGLWTFLAGVGAVVAPLFVHFYRKKQKHRQIKKTGSEKNSTDIDSTPG
jgi:hypothetical protein